MRFPEKRKLVMQRSVALGHCICNPKQPCPCDALLEQDLCPCAGERPDPPRDQLRLTRHTRKAGCGSKISHADLHRVLAMLPVLDDPNVIVGVAAGDDAGVYRIGGEYDLMQTVDVFAPIVDDPFTFGRIAAANSLSDIYAMGGRPVSALSIIGFPIEILPHEVMADILRGGLETMREAGVSVIGGHSINDEEVKCGFAVTGLIRPGETITNAGARPGDHLVLTKPIGTGIIAFAAQIGLASAEAVRLTSESMAALNRDAADYMRRCRAHACTDVTGFGLLGHLSEIAQHSGVSIQLDLASVPIFAEALGCVRRDVIPGANLRNRESFTERMIAAGDGDETLIELLYDAQTSGGLLVALAPDDAVTYVAALRDRGHSAVSRIGTVIPQGAWPVQVLLGKPRNLIGTYREPNPAEAEAFTEAVSVDVPCCQELPPESPCCAHSESEPPSVSRETEKRMEERTMKGTRQESAEAFTSMMQAAAAPGVVDAKTKRLLAIALSISQRCAPCFRTHLRLALGEGITREEIEEVAWVATSFTGCTGRMFYQEIMKELGGT